MPFDPSKPFTVVEEESKQTEGFDPSKPFTVVEEESKQTEGFDPNKPFTVIEKEEEYDTSFARKYLADPALSIAKGVTQLPDVVSGLADTFVLSPINAATKALGAPSEIQDLSVGKLFENIEEQLPDALRS